MTTEKLEEALVFAAQLHARQRRKVGSTPYIAHLLAVASIVMENDGDEDISIAALLHDAVEDQGGAETLEKIRGKFGDRVAAIVKGCSDTDQFPKPPWRERKEGYLEHLRTAPSDVRLVSAADTLHNMRTVLMNYRREREKIWVHFKGGREGTLWWYRSLTNLHLSFGPTWLAEELQRTMDQIETLAGGSY